jgi:hypothetical protein
LVVEFGGMRYLATSTTIRIYQPDGTLVDKMTSSALPSATLQRIGKVSGLLLLQTPQGVFSSADGLDWKPAEKLTVEWSRPQPLPPAIKAQIAGYFSPSLPLERILLDIHSGRILGRHGPLMMDLAAFALIVLSLSGVWIYLRSIRKRN